MIECILIPDGQSEIPAEARDDGIVASHLSAANADIEGNNSVVISWRNVERVTHRERVTLRVEGTLSEYQQTALDAITAAYTSNISGVKVHPDGWQEVPDN